MNKNLIAVLVAVVAVVGLAIIVVANRSMEEPTSTQSTDSAQNGQDNTMSSDSETVTETAETNMIDIEDFDFMPEVIRVKKGTTVTWTNKDEARHDITPDEPSLAFEASELLAQGESYSFTFEEVGTYTYFCSPHPYMKGTVEVTE